MNKKFWKGVIIGLILVLPFWLWVESKAFGATVYVKNIAGSIYYDSTATCCDDVTIADTGPSDIDTAAGAIGADGTVCICAGTYTGTQIDGDSQLTPRNSQIIIGIGTVLLDGNNVPNAVIYRDGGPGATLRNIRVTGSTFNGIQMRNLNSCVIDQCVVYENAHTGIYIYARDQNVTGLEITDNTVYNNGGADASGDNQILLKARVGAAAYTITDPIITGNTVYGSLNTGYSGIKLWGAYTDPNTGTVTGAIITGNEIYGMEYGGIDLYGNVDNSTVSGNNIHDLEWYGVHVQGHAGADDSSGNTIKDNTISTITTGASDGAGVLIDNLAGVNNTINNNTIKDCEEAGVKVRGTTTDILSNLIYGTGVYGIFYQAALDTVCPDTFNNTIVGNFSGGGIYVQAGATCAGGAGNMQNNIVYDTGTSPYGIYIHTDCSATENYNCVYGFDTHNFADQNGAMAAGANSIASDPLFVDAANDDFTLMYLSPCKDTGLDLGNGLEYGIHPNTGDAVDQDSYGSGWEIGVYVHDSTTTLGADDTHSYSLIPIQGGLHVPEGATGCNIVNDGIPGTLDLDETVDVTNTWVTTVDLAGIGAGEVVLAYNCGFVQSQAAINATLGAGTFTPDAECQFSITVGDCFTDYAGADYTIPITSPFVDAGEAHAVARVDLPGNPLCSWFDIGCYEYQDGVDVIKYYLRADGTAAYAESKGPCATVGNCMTIATHDACTYSGSDIIYLCDDGGDYNATQMDFPSSGSAGSVIAYEAETGDSPKFDGGSARAYCINFNSKHYITVNGVEVTAANTSNILMSGDNCIVSEVKSTAANGNNIGISGTSNTVKYCYLDAGPDGIADSGGTNEIYYVIFDTQTDDAIITTAVGSKYYNLTIYDPTGDGIELQANAEVKNVVFESVGGSDINENGGSVTASNNYASSDGDPLFTNAAGDDFTLLTGSPCINAGIIPAGFEAIYPLDPKETVLSPWAPVVMPGDIENREIGAYGYWPGLHGPFGLSLGMVFD